MKTIDFGNGIVGKIYHDIDAENPYEGDDSTKIVILHRRYCDPAKWSCGKTPEEVERWAKKHPGWFVMPLWLYDHSGTVYRVAESNPFHCPWDSGRVGIIAIRKKDWSRKNDPNREQKLIGYCNDIAETFTMWANGETYRYEIWNEHDECIDSCGGHIGMEYVEEDCRKAAKSYILE